MEKLTGKFRIDEKMVTLSEKADAKKALKIFKSVYTFEDLARVYTENTSEYVPYIEGYGGLEVEVYAVGENIEDDDISNCHYFVRFYMMSNFEVRRVTLFVTGMLELDGEVCCRKYMMMS